MESDEPALSGTLLFPLHGLVLAKMAKKKSWQPKFCLLFKPSKQGIGRLEVYDSEGDCNCQRIVTLESCVKITRTSPTSIVVVEKSHDLQSHEISAPSEAETAEWLRALQAVAFGESPAIDEDNDLYCSSGEGVFSVTLCPSEASDRCGLKPGEYALHVTASAIELRDAAKLLATWPYRYIRRYGYRGGKFTFEAGRKCETGEGAFHVKHSNQREIFRCLSSKMKSMKKIISGELEWSDRLHMMESRSRSPLPPFEFDFGPVVSLKSNEPKPNPIKPPRKTLATPYDRVEVRNEAWKTLGINDIDHVEFPRDAPEKNNCLRLISRSQDNLNSSSGDSTKVVILQSPALDPEDANYDRLQYFGSTSRLNRSDGYKSMFARPMRTRNEDEESKATWNDYDEVENVMQSVRLADDSYLGYGMLRKPSVPGPQVPMKSKPGAGVSDDPSTYTDVDHCAFNGTSYAIVSKPKQV